MKNCPNCYTANDDSAAFCITCGAPLDDEPDTTPLTQTDGAFSQANFASGNPHQYAGGDDLTSVNDYDSYAQMGNGGYNSDFSQNSGDSFSNTDSYGRGAYSGNAYSGQQSYAGGAEFTNIASSPYDFDNRSGSYGSIQSEDGPVIPVTPEDHKLPKKKKKGLKIAVWSIVVLLIAALAGFAVWWFIFRTPETGSGSSSSSGNTTNSVPNPCIFSGACESDEK